MGRQFLRWAGTDTTTRLALFEANQAAFMNDLGQRTPIVRNHLQNHFSLPRQVDVTLDVFPEMTGKVHISTLKPDTYPWQGVYFDGVPIRLEAVAEEGFVFSHWSSNPLLTDTLNAVFLDTLAANAVTFVAHFVPDDFPTASDDRHVVPGAAFLYPNPTTTQLNIVQLDTNAPAFTRCVLADMRGQLLLEERWPDARAITTLNIAALATGPYQVFLFGEDGKRQVLRFVKL
jgi:hypothetical protein